MSFEKKGNIGYVYFDEPKNVKYYDHPEDQSNIDPNKTTELILAFEELDSDKDIRVVILTGKGEKFSSGGKIPGYPNGPLMAQFAYGDRGIKQLETIFGLSKPIIAAVNGSALAGGLMFVAACDLAVAGRDCMFGLPEIERGYFPMIAMAILQKEIPKKRLFELALTNKLVTANTMMEWGLINKVVDQDKVLDAAEEMAKVIATYNSVPVHFGRHCYYKMVNMNLANALEYSKSELINMLWTDDVRETAKAALENRPPKYVGQ